jgi:hypothetical protein
MKFVILEKVIKYKNILKTDYQKMIVKQAPQRE